jgi:hypothetical protein
VNRVESIPSGSLGVLTETILIEWNRRTTGDVERYDSGGTQSIEQRI